MQVDICIIFSFLTSLCWCTDISLETKLPTVVFSVLVRNKEHTLPYFLSCIRNIDYPKDRINIWIHTDYNQDRSIKILDEWVKQLGEEYNDIYLELGNSTRTSHLDELKPSHWSPLHFKHVINLREEALHYARKVWADYIFMIDADVFLTNPLILKALVSKKLDIVAPMLISDGLYSNFWCGMSDIYYYERTDEYEPILKNETVGCFKVPMVHSAVLMNLRTYTSDKLTYDPNNIKNYNGPIDDIIAFAINAKTHDIAMHICNDMLYGFLPVPLEETQELEEDYEQLLNVKLKAISRGVPLPLESYLSQYVAYPPKWTYNCNQIFMINLKKREERKHFMMESFKELAMDATIFEAVDGQQLDMNNLSKLSITLMPNYEDPYRKRPMTAGEIGCFLSHFYIWEEIVKKSLETTLVLEDDIRFEPNFRIKFLSFLKDLSHLDWDFAYIGRKYLISEEEVYITPNIVKPLYSYWTLGYVISLKGAKKLLAAKPLSNVLPVDEFLPIMFDQHPNETWKSHFPVRNFKAYSAAPLLIHPTHYTGQVGYISDTENSSIINVQPDYTHKTDL